MPVSSSNWTIEVCERPSNRGRLFHTLYLRRKAGHVFLVLKDGSGRVVAEMHPTTFEDNWRSGLSTPKLSLLTRALENTETIATMMGQHRTLRSIYTATGLVRRCGVMRVCILNRARDDPKAVTRHKLEEGSKDGILKRWRRLRESAGRFNLMNKPFYRFAPGEEYNCRTTAAWLLGDCGYNIQVIQWSLATVGWRTDAVERHPFKRSQEYIYG